MKHVLRVTVVCLLVVALLAVPLLGCGNGGGGKVKITIGVITDFTGVGAEAFKRINLAIEDLAKYYNEQNLIPGVELKLALYDAQYTPSRYVPGYDWLKQKGAKIILTPDPEAAEILKSFAATDKIPLCTWMASEAMVDPPGWVFCAAGRASSALPTLLEWISEQWPSYPTRPKIAAVGCQEVSMTQIVETLEQYCRAHPDRFEYAGKYLAPMGTTLWSGQVEKVKDCDYIVHNQAMTFTANFLKQLRSKGSTARTVDLDAQASAIRYFLDMCGWEELDGHLSFFPWGWWGDPLASIELAEELLNRYHLAAEAADIRSAGNGYLALYAPMVFFDILRQTVEEVGAEDFDGQAFYNTAINFSKTYDGFPERAFTETRRAFPNEAAVYEWRAEVKDIVRISDWLSYAS
jgi:hypothetical protein